MSIEELFSPELQNHLINLVERRLGVEYEYNDSTLSDSTPDRNEWGVRLAFKDSVLWVDLQYDNEAYGYLYIGTGSSGDPSREPIMFFEEEINFIKDLDGVIENVGLTEYEYQGKKFKLNQLTPDFYNDLVGNTSESDRLFLPQETHDLIKLVENTLGVKYDYGVHLDSTHTEKGTKLAFKNDVLLVDLQLHPKHGGHLYISSGSVDDNRESIVFYTSDVSSLSVVRDIINNISITEYEYDGIKFKLSELTLDLYNKIWGNTKEFDKQIVVDSDILKAIAGRVKQNLRPDVKDVGYILKDGVVTISAYSKDSLEAQADITIKDNDVVLLNNGLIIEYKDLSIHPGLFFPIKMKIFHSQEIFADFIADCIRLKLNTGKNNFKNLASLYFIATEIVSSAVVCNSIRFNYSETICNEFIIEARNESFILRGPEFAKLNNNFSLSFFNTNVQPENHITLGRNVGDFVDKCVKFINNTIERKKADEYLDSKKISPTKSSTSSPSTVSSSPSIDNITATRLVALMHEKTLVGYRFKTNVGDYDISLPKAEELGISQFKVPTAINLESKNGLLMSSSEVKSGKIIRDISKDTDLVSKLYGLFFQ